MRFWIKYFAFGLLFNLINSTEASVSTNSLLNIFSNCKEIMDSNPDSAYRILQTVLDTSNLTKESKAFPYLLIGLGDYHRITGNYDTSYVKYFNALKIFEQRKEINLIAETNLNIGILFDLQHDPKNAIKKYYAALNGYLITNDTNGVVKSYMNLGIAYKNLGLSSSNNKMIDSAFVNYKKAEFYLNKIVLPHGLSKLYINIGNLKFTQQLFVEAIFYYKKALKIAESNQYLLELALVYDNLGWAYKEINDYNSALNYAKEGLKIGKQLNSKYNIVNSLANISEIYHLLNNDKQAYKHLNQLIIVNDSLINENTLDLQNKLQSKYESEKKDNEILLLNSEKEKNEAISLAEQKKKNIIIISITLGLFLVLLFSFFLYKRYLFSQKQKKIIELQKSTVDQKNKDITDSINYAKRIQTALLKEEEHINKSLPPHFIFFQPKDIVSGDFYWTHQKNDFLYIAAADCTGHGVPGAFLTMLGTAFLNEITAHETIQSPSKILDELRAKFITELGQTGKEGESRDGMDISLVQLNLKNKKIQWSGANNPLYIIKAGTKELLETKGNKQPIGFYHNMIPFNNYSFQLSKNDTLFIFSDGYADQFGGEKGKKFMYKAFKKLLIEGCSYDMQKQKEILDNTFNRWKGSLEQIDDVCVIGVKI